MDVLLVHTPEDSENEVGAQQELTGEPSARQMAESK